MNEYPIVAEYKAMMQGQGALASMMSGSGPTVFGLVERAEEAKRIAAFLRCETRAAVFVTETCDPVKSGEEHLS